MPVSFALGMRLWFIAALTLGTVRLAASQENSSSSPADQPTQSPQEQSLQKPAAQKPDAQIQSPQGSQTAIPSGLVFHSSVHRVVVDVVVTDSNQKPVRGLSRTDFTVTEDGKPQQALSFDVHDFDAPTTALPKVPKLPSNTFVNVPKAPERGPLYVILYDMVNMAMDDQATARRQILQFIRDKPAGARFAIFVYSDGLRLIQGFTDDQVELYNAMDPKNPRPHVPRIFLQGDNHGTGDVLALVRVFKEISRFLEPMPERKNLIWLTGSMVSSFLPTADPNKQPITFSNEIKEAVNAMAHSQVAVYPVDVRGAVTTTVVSRVRGGSMSTMSNSPVLNASYATENDFATATGGHAFYSTNDVKDALTQATENGGSYYTLSYSPSNQNYDGSLRKIHVDLSRRGYSLAYRRSYYGDSSFGGNSVDKTAKEKNQQVDPILPAAPKHASDSLLASMQHGAPLSRQLVFSAHIRTLEKPPVESPVQSVGLDDLASDLNANHKKAAKSKVPLQSYAIDLAVSVHPPKATDTEYSPDLEFAAVVFDGDGQVLNSIVQASEVSEVDDSPGSGPRDVYRAVQKIDAPVNAASIRIAVRDAATNRIGSMEVPLPLAPEPKARPSSAVDSGPVNSRPGGLRTH